jgi:hypothetical protein
MRRWRVPVALMLAIGVLIYWSVRNFAEHLVPLAVVEAVSVPFVYVVMVVHQSSFLLGGLALGFRLEQWQVGPLVILRTPEGWRLRHVWRWWLLLAGEGTTFTLTPERLRWRHATLVACQPAAVLTLGASLIVAAALLHEGPILILAAGAGAFLMWSLVPRKARDDGQWSVGLWLERWLFQPDVAARWIAVGELHAASQSRVRPRSWDERWVALAAGGPTRPDPIGCLAGLQYGYAAALDRGDVEQAGVLLDRLVANLEMVPENLRRALRIEPAFFAARFRHDAALAAQLLEQAGDPGSAIAAGDLERAHAAAHHAGGHQAAALAECEAAAAAMNSRPPTGWGLLDRELLDALCEDVRRALPVTQ